MEQYESGNGPDVALRIYSRGWSGKRNWDLNTQIRQVFFSVTSNFSLLCIFYITLLVPLPRDNQADRYRRNSQDNTTLPAKRPNVYNTTDVQLVNYFWQTAVTATWTLSLTSLWIKGLPILNLGVEYSILHKASIEHTHHIRQRSYWFPQLYSLLVVNSFVTSLHIPTFFIISIATPFNTFHPLLSYLGFNNIH